MRDTDKAGCGLLAGGIFLMLFGVPISIFVAGFFGWIESPGEALFVFLAFAIPLAVARQVMKDRKAREAAADPAAQPSSSDTE